MKSFKVGGFKTPSFSRPETRSPSFSAPRSPPPTPRQPPVRDGFDSSSTRGTSWNPFGRQSPPNVTSQFAAHPENFACNNMLNGYNMFPGKSPDGVKLPTSQNPWVHANDSKVSLNVHQQNGNSNLSLSHANTQGAPAHYLHYQSTGTGRFAGIEGVPLHPQPGQPNMVVTGPLNGCAVHALQNKDDHTLSFVHHADFSRNGRQEYSDFLAQNQHLRPLGSFGPSDYAHSTGNGRIETGATAFAHYYTRPGHTQGEWQMVGQLNDWQNGGDRYGRPQLGWPEKLSVPTIQTIPLKPE
ncbi:hypothetical protein [Hyalangium gracile]|uniref:hypothetical protein n=1 Tax=Hyalangium gracile TaxID=394092 RepID=UPI001CCB248D|nr:hypothetical protein [Hyalangium gracile]